MTEAHTTRAMHEAIEKAHKERAAAFATLFSNWFGLKPLLPTYGATHHA